MKSMHNSKKGDFKFIVAAVLGTAAIVLLLFFIVQFYATIKEKMEIQDCKNSIAAHAILASATSREVFTDIKCPIRYKTINVQNEFKAKTAIAEDMHRCWYEWNKGDGQYFEGDGIFCHICSIYTFKQKDRRIDGFAQFLAREPIQAKYPGDQPGLSYQDYFQGYSTPNSKDALANANVDAQLQEYLKNDYINTSINYATVFVYASGKKALEKALEGGGRTTLGTAGGLGLTLGGIMIIKGATVAIGAIASAVAGTATVNAWNPIGWVLGGALLIGVGIYAIYVAVTPEDPQWISFIQFTPYDAQALANLGCQKADVTQLSHSELNK